MSDYGFYTEKELKDLAVSDLSFEIADTGLLNTTEADEYFKLLVTELKKRGE